MSQFYSAPPGATLSLRPSHWYENGKRKAKALPTKALAEHFWHIKYAQLNSDVFTSVIDFDWLQIVEEHKRYKRVEGLDESSIYEVVLTLRHYERLIGPNSSKDITQQSLDTFVLKRSEEIKKNTLNKDIKNLHAFLKWASKNRFVAPDLKVNKVKVAPKPVTSLSSQQVRKLMTIASKYPTLRLRILLAVTTGLRRGDIEAIHIADIQFDRNIIATRNRKAKRVMPERPSRNSSRPSYPTTSPRFRKGKSNFFQTSSVQRDGRR